MFVIVNLEAKILIFLETQSFFAFFSWLCVIARRYDEANRRFNGVNLGVEFVCLDCFVPRNDVKRTNGQRHKKRRPEGLLF